MRLRPPGFTDNLKSPAKDGRDSERSRGRTLPAGGVSFRFGKTGGPGGNPTGLTGKPAPGTASSITVQIPETGPFKGSGKVLHAPAGNPGLAGEAPLLELARTLSLPPDSLSAALLSFCRFFSLPLEKNLLLRFHRESLGSGGGKEPGRLREARALGAAAAADKGVSLDPGALEEYARAITGDTGLDAGGGFGTGTGDPGEETEHSGETPGNETDGNGTIPAEETQDHDKKAGERLYRKIRGIEAKKPLLRLLNSIPGKNGRRWVVFPFHFASGGVEIEVSVRILLYNQEPETVVDRLALDLAAGDRHWLFVLDKPGGAGSRADIYLQPPPGGFRRAGLEAELRELLGKWTERLTLHPGEFPLADGRNGVLPSVNEEV